VSLAFFRFGTEVFGFFAFVAGRFSLQALEELRLSTSIIDPASLSSKTPEGRYRPLLVF